MKNLIRTVVMGLVALVLVGCEDDNQVIVIDNAPASPQGVYSVTGDNAVYVYWNGPYEKDINSYLVYRSPNSTTGYTQIGSVNAVANPNLDLIVYEYIDNSALNGQTYYYAVSSVDNGGHVSDLSAEEVFDTPRPEGTAVILDMAVDPSVAGYDLSARTNVAWNNANADVYVDRAGGIFYLNVEDVLTDIQDVGYTSSFNEIGYAPTDGWSEVGFVELILGHTYIIWTRDLNYAKMRVESINPSSVSFRWAYQTDADNPELVIAGNPNQKPNHNTEYLRKPKGNDVPIQEAR